jgi:hypothetical protein
VVGLDRDVATEAIVERAPHRPLRAGPQALAEAVATADRRRGGRGPEQGRSHRALGRRRRPSELGVGRLEATAHRRVAGRRRGVRGRQAHRGT